MARGWAVFGIMIIVMMAAGARADVGVGSGTVVHRERIALPAQAVVEVELEAEAAPDLAALEARVAALQQGLGALERIEGRRGDGDQQVTYVAFVDQGVPVVVTERVDLGERGSGRATMHLEAGRLLRYRSHTRILAQAGAPSDGWYNRSMTIYFDAGRFVAGSGMINSRAAEPDEHEVRAAYRRAQALAAWIAEGR